MPHTYTEEHLVEQPASQLFGKIGWTTVSAMDEAFSPNGTLGRETKSDAVLLPRLCAALERLNTDLPAEAISLAITELARDRSTMSLAAANREVWELVR